MDSRRFTVALSFPGEHRDFVSRVADCLAEKLSKPRILYDKYHEAEFARPNLDVHLPNLYRTESDLIAIFLCEEYKKKRWCKLEWRYVRQLISTADEDRIMFLSFDEVGAIPEIGILDGDGYVSIARRSAEEIAALILQRLDPGSLPGLDEWSVPVNGIQVAPSRLHHGADHLFGREDELAALDQVWNDPSKHVLTIVAFGGVGKTSLVFEWMARRAAANWLGFDRVFDWSFFSQGTRDQGAASADAFIVAALKFFGDERMSESAASPWDKGARLAHLVALQRALLVLDGVEPLQHPPGSLAGELKDPALSTLLKGLAQRNSGLCIVTTRERVADLGPFQDTTSPEWQLQHLSTPAGVELIKTLGVRGTNAEFQQLVKEVKGHALTLNLLGRYLAKAHKGDIRKRHQVKFEKADAATQGGYAFKTIGAYEKWLSEGGKDGQRARAILRLLGLFDRPADAGCLAALRSEPAITGLTEPVIGLDEDDWNITVSSLADCGLVSVQSDESAIDAHPLIREYFAKRLRENNLDAWHAAHRRLYEYLRDSTPDKPQPTIEDLQPLYQAVAHGCQAEMQQEAWDKIYEDRILRGDEFYSSKKLGAMGSNLGAIAYFFEPPWRRLSPLLTARRATVLNEAAFYLRALGRLTEALEPRRAGLENLVKQEDWRNAAASASNLSELELTLGEVAGALGDAEQSVIYSDRSDDANQQNTNRARAADALHQAGRREEAEARFREAETLQAETQPAYPLLYSMSGFQYCDLLLAAPERSVWVATLECNDLLRLLSFGALSPSETRQAPPGESTDNSAHAKTLRAISQRAAQTLQWVEGKLSHLTVALDHLTLARAALYEAILEGSSIDPCHASLHHAMEGLRLAGVQEMTVRGLLTRAWLRFLNGDAVGARADLDETREIADRGPMRLHMADIHLYRARLFHSVKPYPWTSPQEDLVAARKLIEQCGYWRRKEELEDAEAAAKNW